MTTLAGLALITGAGRGFGRAFALGLAACGMKVAVAARTRSEVEATAEAVRGQGGEAHAFALDVTDAHAVAAMRARVEDQLGPVDLLVNNAASGPPFGPTWETDATQWWRTFEVNVRGPLLLCHAVLPGMVARKRGRVINIASGAGTRAIPYMSSYATSKCALIRLTETLAEELREHGVSIFAVHPGTVRTAMAEELMASEAGDRWLPWFRRIFEDGEDEPVEPAVELIIHLASGAADARSGGFFSAPARDR